MFTLPVDSSSFLTFIFLTCCPLHLIGSLSIYDGNKNVRQKVNSRCFKLLLAYSISFNLSNVGEFFWS